MKAFNVEVMEAALKEHEDFIQLNIASFTNRFDYGTTVPDFTTVTILVDARGIMVAYRRFNRLIKWNDFYQWVSTIEEVTS